MIGRNRHLVHESKRGICNGNNMMGTKDEIMVSIKDITTNNKSIPASLNA